MTADTSLGSRRPRVLVMDDDPTGSQVVRDVELQFDLDGLRERNPGPGETVFVLTNSRSMDPPAAQRIAQEVGLAAASLREAGPLILVARSDSTLRGHVLEESTGLVDGLAQGGSRAGVRRVFCPAYVPAGRITEGDVHYCTVDGAQIPVAQTPFAMDPEFGYASSNLREFLVERGVAPSVDAVLSVSTTELRDLGPDRVAQVAESAGDAWLVINATTEADLDVAAAGLTSVACDGLLPLVRSGPSLVRALAGQAPPPPLTPQEIRAPFGPRTGGGLVVVGSHVPLATQQLRDLLVQPGVAGVEVDVAHVAAKDSGYSRAVVERACRPARDVDVVLWTSREVRRDGTGLQIARRTSAFLSDVTRRVAQIRKPAWIVAKGGITSHDTARDALGIRRGCVVGQLFPGQVSLVRPHTDNLGTGPTPYVIFAGNVGGPDGLTQVRRLLHEAF